MIYTISIGLLIMEPLSSIKQQVWRSPGYCEIPNVLGKAYLKPELPSSLDLRPYDPSKRVSKVKL